MTEHVDQAAPRAVRGAVTPSERALAPDLARGLMLLLIVVSNTGFHLWAAPHGPSGWHPVDGSAADTVAQLVMITALDGRIYPLFAFLLGYGMVQLYRRQTAAGATPKQATALLRRRSLWLIVFGAVHAALLLAGDIIAFYGIVSLVVGWLFVRRSDRTVAIAAGVSLLIGLAIAAPALWALATGDLAAVGAPAAEPSIAVYASGEENALVAAQTRMTTWLYVAGLGAIAWITSPELLLGFLAARRRVLDDPSQHLRLLRVTAVVGVLIGWLGGLPLALAHVGWWDVPPAALGEEGALSALAGVTGLPGGLGYVAAFALLARRMQAREGRPPVVKAVVVAVAAVGKRSLSSYLAHSLIFAPVLAAWGLGLGAHLGSATMVLFAVGVWLVTVGGAYALERRGLRGPAEVLLRRLAYGRR